ncbi:MAG: hypothetical protein U0M54_07325 [Bacteroidales bacterium]|nr:hypothetical protein [Bacteroides sp.]
MQIWWPANLSSPFSEPIQMNPASSWEMQLTDCDESPSAAL